MLLRKKLKKFVIFSQKRKMKKRINKMLSDLHENFSVGVFCSSEQLFLLYKNQFT
jgi:predicted patatin/cPLA2 family phospholipase